jgi:transcriptional regulator with XRE-family HTH domain
LSPTRNPPPRWTLSDQLREVILARRISAYELGRAAGVAAPVIQRFLNGQRSLTLTTVDRLAEVLRLRIVEVGMSRRARPPAPVVPPADVPELPAIAGDVEAPGDAPSRPDPFTPLSLDPWP